MSVVAASTVQIAQAVGALTLSALALGWSVYTWRTNRKAEADKHAREGERRDDELLAWSSQGIDVMAAIEALAEHDPAIWEDGDFDRRRVELGASASAILDKGRVFFPNRQGYRPKILDELKVACLVAEDISHDTPHRNCRRAEELWQARGRFVGYLRDAVGDRRERTAEAAQAGRRVGLEDLPSEMELAADQGPAEARRPERGRRAAVRGQASRP